MLASRCQRSRAHSWKISADAGGQGWAQRCSENKDYDVEQDKQDANAVKTDEDSDAMVY
jgi:hypothetical protein